MNTEKNSGILDVLDSNFILFALQKKAATIKNGYLLKDTLHSLLSFVDSSNLRLTNP